MEKSDCTSSILLFQIMDKIRVYASRERMFIYFERDLSKMSYFCHFVYSRFLHKYSHKRVFHFIVQLHSILSLKRYDLFLFLKSSI